MKFSIDNRAQAMQIGFILIFGILILSLSLYQANVVPDQNRQAEITHSNDLEFDFAEIQASIFNTGMTGNPSSQTYPMSMRYQDRFITINPVPPSGTLSTSSTNNIIIENSSVEHQVPTRYLMHDVDYRLYENPPIYTLESGFIYRNFGDSQTKVTENQFVLNNGFAIVALQGEYNETSYDTTRLRFEQTDSLVQYRIEDPEITVPTKLDERHWRDFEDRKSNVEIEYNDDNPDEKSVTILRSGEMSLYLTSVSLGESNDGGVNHANLDLPEVDSPTTPGPSDPSDPSDGFEFDSVFGDRVDNNQIDYSFEVSAGNADITQVEVRLEHTNGGRDTQIDTYDSGSAEFNPRGFSVDNDFTGLGGPSNEYELVFVAENEDGDVIEEVVSGL